jgi:hypothetical protein
VAIGLDGVPANAAVIIVYFVLDLVRFGFRVMVNGPWT